MQTIIVKTQAEWDALPEKFEQEFLAYTITDNH